MPKTKLARPTVSCWEKYRGAVLSRMVEYQIGITELAPKMMVSPPTMRKYLQNPGVMPLDTMRRLNRVLDISAEDARQMLAVK